MFHNFDMEKNRWDRKATSLEQKGESGKFSASAGCDWKQDFNSDECKEASTEALVRASRRYEALHSQKAAPSCQLKEMGSGFGGSLCGFFIQIDLTCPHSGTAHVICEMDRRSGNLASPVIFTHLVCRMNSFDTSYVKDYGCFGVALDP